MALIESPEACSAVMALSRPEPGPLTLTSTSWTPYFVAVAAAVSAARWAANGVLLRLPLNPTVPDEAQHNASPLGAVMVAGGLLKVALMCTMARLTLRRAFRFLALATGPSLPEVSSSGFGSRGGIPTTRPGPREPGLSIVGQIRVAVSPRRVGPGGTGATWGPAAAGPGLSAFP